jgi:DNA polymerase-3 subunit delta
VVALSGGNMDFSLDDLVGALLRGDKKQVAKELQNLENAGENAIFIIRVILNFFMRLVRLKLMLMEGKNIENALLSLKPPAFFKNKTNMIMGSKKYQLADLQRIVKNLTDLELLTKKGIINPELLVNQALMVF